MLNVLHYAKKLLDSFLFAPGNHQTFCLLHSTMQIAEIRGERSNALHYAKKVFAEIRGERSNALHYAKCTVCIFVIQLLAGALYYFHGKISLFLFTTLHHAKKH